MSRGRISFLVNGEGPYDFDLDCEIVDPEVALSRLRGRIYERLMMVRCHWCRVGTEFVSNTLVPTCVSCAFCWNSGGDA